MLQPRNTMPVLAALVLVFAARAATAQVAGDGEKPAGDSPAKQGPALERVDAEIAFDWVQAWVRSEDGVPANTDLPENRVTGLFGVYVILREDGKVLGRGQALRSDVDKTIDQPGPPLQMATLLAAATRQALDELQRRHAEEAKERGVDDPKMVKLTLMAKRERLQVDLQLGYKLESIRLPRDSDKGAILNTFAPGFHGLRMDGPLSANADYAWPAVELASNNPPPRQLFRLLKDQGYEADDLPLIAREDGPSLQRFEVLHVVRPRQAQPMRQLVRGGLVLRDQAVDTTILAGLSEYVARYLDALIVYDNNTGQMVVRGVYQPSNDRYLPQVSDDLDSALLGYAVMRHARVAIEAGVGGPTMEARAKRVLRLVNVLTPRALPKDKTPKQLTVAFLLLALCESPIDLQPKQVAVRDRLGAALLALRHAEGGYSVEAGSEKRLSRPAAAVITHALCAWYEQTRDRKLVVPTWTAMTELMDVNTDDPKVVDLMWMSLAISKAGPLLAKAQAKPDDAAASLEMWRATMADNLNLLIDQQVFGKPVLGPDDVRGGFILRQATPGSPPNPTWQSAMPLTIIATSLRDPDIIDPDNSLGQRLSVNLGARFIGQLIVSESSAYYQRNIDRAIGGVRSTLWDNRLYPDRSALALIALTEVQLTLNKIEAESRE